MVRMSTKIKFVAIENHAHSDVKTGSCVASVVHNGIWTKEILAMEAAKRVGLTSIQANAFMDALNSVVCEGIATGNKVNFGPFSIGISMKGSLKVANDKFNSAKNALGVFFVPARALLRALADLEPENATVMDRPWLWEVGSSGIRALNVVKIGARVVANGTNIRIDLGQEDEGVWLESMTGERLAKAEILTTEHTRLVCVFNGSVAPELCQLAVYTRDGGAANGAVGVVRRRVKVVL